MNLPNGVAEVEIWGGGAVGCRWAKVVAGIWASLGGSDLVGAFVGALESIWVEFPVGEA